MIETEKNAGTELSRRLRKRKVWCFAFVYFCGPLHFCAQYVDDEVHYIAIGAVYQKCNPMLVWE